MLIIKQTTLSQLRELSLLFCEVSCYCSLHIFGLKHGHVEEQYVLKALIHSVVATVYDVLLGYCNSNW